MRGRCGYASDSNSTNNALRIVDHILTTPRLVVHIGISFKSQSVKTDLRCGFLVPNRAI